MDSITPAFSVKKPVYSIPPAVSMSEKKEISSTGKMIQMVVTILGVVISLSVMFGMGIGGAIPGAAFGAVGGVVGSLLGALVASNFPAEPRS